mmetsp:Transcript_10022/g.14178  ORF Transcript_10022/g.14178 Transcript_10022/m.14178 type:complete len:281 (+) Transcript_10022:173-1015(+)
MGVFQISPFDKGGQLYQPSKTCALLIGKEISPMAFAALWGWKKIGFHTTSVGIARPTDLVEVMEAVKWYSLDESSDKILNDVDERFKAKKEEVLGKEWVEKGLLNIPSCYDETSHGMAIGHMLWCHDLVKAFGMYTFAKKRYLGLETSGKSWNSKKTFAENAAKIPGANPGREYDTSVDLTKALENHYNPALVLDKLKEVHSWLTCMADEKIYTTEELSENGWEQAYDLKVWEEMCSDIDSRHLKQIVFTILTGGRTGLKPTGPGYSFKTESSQLRASLQ